MPLQRISIDLALGCPNRSGGGWGEGCIFCSEDGARARHLSRTGLDLDSQIRRGKEYVARRYGSDVGYIAYFQSFTSTYAPVDKLRELYEYVLAAADFKALIISTRPDALPCDVLDYLRELSQRYELFVELGIQSAHDRTLKEINRGHDFESVKKACDELHKRNIKIAGHFILGLPGESFYDWVETAKKAAQLPLSAVKMHQLMVLKNTALARRYGENHSYVSPLNEYEYAAGLKAFLQQLPEKTLLMRLMADADDNMLEAPRWWMKKGQFLSFFKDYFYNDDAQAQTPFIVTRTDDGTPTLYHPGYRQHFHSLAGAGSEAEKKFVEPARLTVLLEKSVLPQKTLHLLDVGFGLGGNAFAAMLCAEKIPECNLEITSLENDPRTLRAAMMLYAADSPLRQLLEDLLKNHTAVYKNTRINLLLDDGRNAVKSLNNEYFDLVWLDAFSCDVNPELWTYQFFRECFRIMNNGSMLLTYSSSPAVRGGLFKAGFDVRETASFGRKRGGTAALKGSLECNLQELAEKEKHIIFDSTAGTPYSDCSLNKTAAEILQHRKDLVEKLRKRGVPKWYKAH